MSRNRIFPEGRGASPHLEDPSRDVAPNETCLLKVRSFPGPCTKGYSQSPRETNSLRRTAQIVECTLLHRRLKQSLLFSQGPRPTFVKTLYTLSVLLKPTPPNSLNLPWKVLKGDTIRLQPCFIIRRVSWLYIVDYTNGCHKDYKGD